ncbi:hypothetical protein P3X46_033186 [Hevea brasiliensis]|uniref:Uncharacterized protein n=1 Tax=Hevea brasiliensis TaxID=3981 RepID=A0ABQ9KH74_HEVBR|nr:hypothetical protein P3X46_033186 [Hevea brasiliensis]
MCSNTSLSSSGGGGGCGDYSGGCGGYSGGYGGESIYSKKPKRQRVPKRGPGVAELEKILREQEKRPDLDKAKNEGFSLVSLPPCSYQPQSPLLPSPNSLPTPVPSFAPNPNNFTPPTTTTFYANNSDSNPPSGGGRSGVHIAGSGVVLPEHALLPTMWNSCEPNGEIGGSRSASGIPLSIPLSNGCNNHFFPSPSLMQRSQHSPPSMKNLFPHPVVTSLATSSSAGPCHGREPPSNQTRHHYTNAWPEEDKAKMMIPPVPPFRYQAPTFSPQMNGLDSSLSCGGHSIINLEPCDTISREMKSGSSSEPNIRKCKSTDTGADNGNFLLFGSPTTPSIQNQRERSKFSLFPFQENNGDSQHMAAQGGSVQNKTFYSFLLPSKQIGTVETDFGLNNERIETRGDGIDLNLRL